MVTPPAILILPFVLLLGAMAFAPALAPVWWQRHYGKIALGLGCITTGASYLLLHDTSGFIRSAHEYLSFITLIVSLYIISGGIRLQVPAPASPLASVLFLFSGAIAANLLGTTGAAILLIRPWIQMLGQRAEAYHIVFFIFLVANIGGCLTPIGDPPLFLGYLHGIPFFWVTQKCWPMWATATSLLLAIFYIIDRCNKAGTETSAASTPTAWRVDGLTNLLFLGMVLSALFLNHPSLLREFIMVLAVIGSYFTTPKRIHSANEFNFHPVTEVAILFAGIFATLPPVLAWLTHDAGNILATHGSPALIYWATGTLSAVLDNAPTYLGFLTTLLANTSNQDITQLLNQKSQYIVAMSLGAVFFGAATYIGNGPNLMVKAIAAQSRIPLPSFAGFILNYTLPILLPVLLVIWAVFLRG